MNNRNKASEYFRLDEAGLEERDVYGRPGLVLPLTNGFRATAQREIAKDFQMYLEANGLDYLVEDNRVGGLIIELVPRELSEESPLIRCRGKHYSVSCLNGHIRLSQERIVAPEMKVLENYLADLKSREEMPEIKALKRLGMIVEAHVVRRNKDGNHSPKEVN